MTPWCVFGSRTRSINPLLSWSSSWTLYLKISSGCFPIRVCCRLFSLFFVNVKFVGRFCLLSFHGSLTLYLPVTLLNSIVSWKCFWTSVTSGSLHSSGILFISQKLVRVALRSLFLVGCASTIWHNLLSVVSVLDSLLGTGPERSHPHLLCVAIHLSSCDFFVFPTMIWA